MGAPPRKGSRRKGAPREGSSAGVPPEEPRAAPPTEPAPMTVEAVPEADDGVAPGDYPRIYEAGIWFSAMEFFPGSRLVLDVDVTVAPERPNEFYAGFMAYRQDASRYLLFRTIGNGELTGMTGASSAIPEAPRARRAMPEGRHTFELDWGEASLRWSVDGETMHEAAEKYDGGGVPHQVVIRGAAGTRVTVHRAPTVNGEKVA